MGRNAASARLPLKAYSTSEGYRNYLTLHVLPKWGKHTLSAIKSVEVEGWLRNLKKVNGQPASPGTKTKIRNLMSALFAHAIRYEWAARNPIASVRTSAKRLRTPDILIAEASRKPVPLPALVIEELKQWRLVTVYRSEDDFLFPSIAKNGAQPVANRRSVIPPIRPISALKSTSKAPILFPIPPFNLFVARNIEIS